MARAREKDGEAQGQAAGSAAVGSVADAAYRIGKVEDVKAVLEVLSGTVLKPPRNEDANGEAMDES